MHRLLWTMPTFLFYGCSISHFFPSTAEKTKMDKGPLASTISNDQNPPRRAEDNFSPVRLEIAQAFFENQKFHVKVYLLAEEPLDPSQFIVTVSGLRDSKVIEERIQRVGDFISSPHLKRGDMIALRFELGASDLSEFQVRCSWGEDARELIARRDLHIQKNEQGSSDEEAVQISDQRIETQNVSCTIPPCNQLYTVSALVINRLPQAVTDLELAAGLFLVDKGGEFLPVQAPGGMLEENEERISLGRLILAPGGQKKVRVTINRPVSSGAVGSFIPQLRILRYASIPTLP